MSLFNVAKQLNAVVLCLGVNVKQLFLWIFNQIMMLYIGMFCKQEECKGSGIETQTRMI